MNYVIVIVTLLIKEIVPICNKNLILPLIATTKNKGKDDYINMNNYYECIGELIKGNEFELLELYINTLSLNQISYKKALISSIKTIQLKLNQLKEKYLIRKATEAIQIIHPSIKWKENSQYIFLQFIYSINHNEPLCNYLDNIGLDLVSDSNVIHFQGDCIKRTDNKMIRFIADIVLEDDLNKLMSIYKDNNSEKSKYTVTLKKKESRIWNKLFKYEKDVPINVIKWKDYNGDNNDFDYVHIHNKYI